MHRVIARPRLTYCLVAVAIIVAAASYILLVRSRAAAGTEDWPPLTMTYELRGQFFSIGPGPAEVTMQVRRLTYSSRDSWIEEIIESEPMNTRVGGFSNTGSYQKLHNGQYITYDAVTDETTTEKVEDGVTMIPRGGLYPFPIKVIEDVYGIQLSPVATTSKVCFYDDCEENAEGMLLGDNGKEYVYADDARGIPLRINDFVIKEVLIQDEKQVIER